MRINFELQEKVQNKMKVLDEDAEILKLRVLNNKLKSHEFAENGNLKKRVDRFRENNRDKKAELDSSQQTSRYFKREVVHCWL